MQTPPLLTIEFGPCLSQNVEEVGLPGHAVLARVARRTTKEDHLGLAYEGDSVPEAGHRDLAIDVELLGGLQLPSSGGLRWYEGISTSPATGHWLDLGLLLPESGTHRLLLGCGGGRHSSWCAWFLHWFLSHDSCCFLIF